MLKECEVSYLTRAISALAELGQLTSYSFKIIAVLRWLRNILHFIYGILGTPPFNKGDAVLLSDIEYALAALAP